MRRTKKYKIPKEAKEANLKIIPYKSDKDKIKQRPLMINDVIPRHASSVLFNGKSNSGKTQLLLNLVTRPHFYGKDCKHTPDKPCIAGPGMNNCAYFDLVFLMSPTADGGDDLPKYLGIPEDRIFTEPSEETLKGIMETQKNLIQQYGIAKSPKILVIMDDVQSDSRFLNSKPVLKAFIQNRHLNISTYLLGQSWTRTPRTCRLQANNIFFFKGSGSEHKLLIDEFCPAGMKKKEFAELVDYATSEPYSFLHINMRKPTETRYCKNLDEIIDLSPEGIRHYRDSGAGS